MPEYVWIKTSGLLNTPVMFSLFQTAAYYKTVGKFNLQCCLEANEVHHLNPDRDGILQPGVLTPGGVSLNIMKCV
jgi:hypothetical protein